MRLLLACACAGFLLVSCGSDSDNSTSVPPGEPNSTSVGTPVGSAATGVIDAAGGSLTSPDSGLTVLAPAGAFAGATTLAIQPITNELSGAGSAYRISTGIVPTAALTLVFSYTDSVLDGSGPASLLAAVQQSDRTWRIVAGHAVDTAARTLTVDVRLGQALSKANAGAAKQADGSQTDAGMMLGRYLEPQSASVSTGGQVAFRMVTCVTEAESDPDGLLAPLTGLCPCTPLSASSGVTWLVDGIQGGSATKGTIPGSASTATYTAPTQAPTPSWVIVQSSMVVYDYLDGATEFLGSRVDISGHDYSGDFQFSGMGGPAGGSIGYTGYGSIGVDMACPTGVTCYTYEGPATVTIESFTPDGDVTCVFSPNTHTGTARIVVDPIAGTYTWHFLTVNWTAMATCTGSSPQPNYPLGFTFAGNPMCGDEWSYTDVSRLTGTFTCATVGTFHWDFRGR
jgi:hypothetical protein